MVLEDLRVVELAEGFAGPFCGLQFADGGADVIKIESPEGDQTRKIGPYNNGISQLYMSLNRGKKSVVLDLRTHEARDAARHLIEHADVVITHFNPGVAKGLGLDYASLNETNPHLIYASISDYGSHGSLANKRGSEVAAQAMSAIWRFLGDMTSKEARAALVEPLRVGTYIGNGWAGTLLFQGALSALLSRRRLGVGQHVEASLLGSIVSIQSQNWAVMTNPDSWIGFEVLGAMQAPNYGAPTKDGAVLGTLGRGNPEKVEQWLREIGVDFNDSTINPAADQGKTLSALELTRLQLGKIKPLKNLTKVEVTRQINELDSWCAPIYEYSEVVIDSQTKHMGIVVDVDHPKGGKFQTIRPPWVLSATPVKPAGRPPLLGENTTEELKKVGLSEAEVLKLDEAKPEFDRFSDVAVFEENMEPVGADRDGPGPLQGIRVVDFSGMAVGPWCGSLLGMLGAQVIKIDNVAGDGILGREPTQNGVPTPYEAFNQGKNQCVGLDLKDREDFEIALAIAKEADILVENFRPGVMERLGLGYKRLSELNPRLVFCSASGYGQTGPMAHYGSADPFSAAFTGYTARNGYKGGAPMSLRFGSTNDLGTSIAIAAGALLGLHARELTGKGQWMTSSMIEGNMYNQTHRFAEFFATGEDPERMGSALPNIVPDQAFATNDSYIAVSATSDEDWGNLCKALDFDNLEEDPRFATNDDRVKNRDALIPMLEEKFKTLPTWWWWVHLQRNDVPCGIYLTEEDIMNHDHFKEAMLTVEVDMPIAGKMKLAGPPLQFSRTPSKVVRPALGVIPNTWRYFQAEIKEKWPEGYPGEHTALVKERYRKKLPLFAIQR